MFFGQEEKQSYNIRHSKHVEILARWDQMHSAPLLVGQGVKNHEVVGHGNLGVDLEYIDSLFCQFYFL